MGSGLSLDEICPRCRCGGCYSFAECRTGEFSFHCSSCGLFESAWLKYDDKGSVVKQNIYYHVDGSLIMGVRAYRPEKSWYTDEIPYDQLPEAGTMLWETPILPNMTYNDVYDFLYPKYDYNAGYKVLAEYHPVYASAHAIKYGFPSLFLKTNSCYKKIWYSSEPFRFEVNPDGQVDLVITEDVMDVAHGGGYGMIQMLSKSNPYTPPREICCKRFDNPISIEDALSIWNSYLTDDLDTHLSYLSV